MYKWATTLLVFMVLFSGDPDVFDLLVKALKVWLS